MQIKVLKIRKDLFIHERPLSLARDVFLSGIRMGKKILKEKARQGLEKWLDYSSMCSIICVMTLWSLIGSAQAAALGPCAGVPGPFAEGACVKV